MGSLYLVSTPIGNRWDISLRALEVLDQCDTVLCEDTRKTGMLLDHYRKEDLLKNKPQLISFFEENELKRINQVISLLKDSKNIALVSNAGTPLISDPGFKLVKECIKEKIEVMAVPGASALLTALVVSGLPTDKFMFLGFLPKKEGKKQKLLEKVKEVKEILPQTVIFYESPFRVVKTLKLIEKLMPEVEIVLARELTKKFEEIQRGTAKELVGLLGEKKIRGEVVVLVN